MATRTSAQIRVLDDVRLSRSGLTSRSEVGRDVVVAFVASLFFVGLLWDFLGLPSMALRVAATASFGAASFALLRGPLRFLTQSPSVVDAWRLRALRRALAAPSSVESAARLARGLGTNDAIRCDASAHEALARLEHGELDRCLVVLERPPWHNTRRRRPRSAEFGNYGEAVYGVLAHLFPDRFTQPVRAEVIAANEPGHPSEYEGLPPMLGALRVLECADAGSRQKLQRAWTEFDADALAESSPLLCALVVDHASRVEPGLVQELGERYRALPPAAQAIVRERRPEIESLDESGYRPRAPRP
ncbi:MAG: hypothetical protein AAF721_00725 [Myxococcota bacterium]